MRVTCIDKKYEMKLVLLSTLLALSQLHVFAQDDYCFGKDNERPQTRQFSTKTAYQIVKGTNMEKQVQVPNCEAQKIWILHRHGTRLPATKTIHKAPRLEQLRDEIVKNYRIRKSKPETGGLCPEDLLAIQMWKWNSSIKDDQENFLTSQGWEDLKGTAKLYQRLYPDVLTNQYSASNFVFRHTNTQRTVESFKAFADSLFGVNASQGIFVPESVDNDTLLRPYEYCVDWIAQDNGIEGPGTEIHKYRNSTIMNHTINDISKRLGFLYQMELADIKLIFDMCRYEQAWHIDRTSAWCAAFTGEQTSVLEYDEDLKYYYKSGYGNEINSRLSCRAVQDMLTQLNSKTAPSALVYFSHSASIQTFLTALGINKDEVPLTADNYNEMSQRRWKTSKSDPFAANFVAVKYNCDMDAEDEEKVIFFLNQEPVDLDWCKVGLCNWSDVMRKYERFYNADCAEYFCARGATGILGVSVSTLLIAAFFYLLY